LRKLLTTNDLGCAASRRCVSHW